MSYNPPPNPVKGQLPPPVGLAHKPLYLLEYFNRDGKYSRSPHGTDSHFLSVGISQWDPNDLSVKALRHTAGKWSRQSEEIPLHRVLDMAELVVQVLVNRDAFNNVTVPAQVFENQPAPLALNELSPKLPSTAQVRNVFNYLAYNPGEVDRLKQRLHALRDQLNTAYDRGAGDFKLS